MRISQSCLPTAALTSLLVITSALAQKNLARSVRIRSAKSVYFDNQAGSDPVGKNALAQLKKWGKFQLVTDPKEADLILLLSADPYKGGHIVFASGQTGSVDSGHINEDPVPDYNKASPARYARNSKTKLRNDGIGYLQLTRYHCRVEPASHLLMADDIASKN